MAINQAVCATFKQQLLDGDHDISSDTIKLALYTDSATLDANTSAYAATNEVGDSGTYAAGGGTLANANVSLTKTNATASTAALIYNTSSANTNASIAVLDFGGVKTSTNGTFTIQFPTNDASSAILRIS
jgi:hypothetical protein